MNVVHPSLRLIGMTAGLLVWSSGLVGLYALHAVGCNVTWMSVAVGPVSLLRVVLLAVWLLHLALLVWLFFRFRRWRSDAPGGTGDRFVAVASAALTAVALVATVYTGLPVIILRQCI